MKDDERFTQDALRRLTPVEPSARLLRMVAQIPIEHPRNVRSLWPFSSLLIPSLSMAAVAFLGIFVGRALSIEENFSATTHARAPAHKPAGNDADSNQKTPSTAGETEATGLAEQDDELDELLILATAGDFAADDWDLSQNPEVNEPDKGTF